MMREVTLYNVDGSAVVAIVRVPDMIEGDQDVILWQDRWFKKIDRYNYWECVNVTVL